MSSKMSQAKMQMMGGKGNLKPAPSKLGGSKKTAKKGKKRC